MHDMDKQELISALADGQLQGEAFARGVEAASGSADAQAAWHAYHLIGDVLRTGESSLSTQPQAFLGRLQARLAAEAVPVAAAPVPAAVVARPEAANDGNFVWKMVAGFASAAAVAAVGWALVAAPGRSGEAQLAAAPDGVLPASVAAASAVPPGAIVANTDRGPMIRDARLDEFMAAHRQLGGASALTMPAGFLRNATYQAPGR